MIDLEAIRKRRDGHDCFVSGCCIVQDGFGADIDALLAEVERLRAEAATDWPDWMRLDAETVLDAMPEIRKDLEWQWPHVDRALDKIESIARVLSAENEKRYPQSKI